MMKNRTLRPVFIAIALIALVIAGGSVAMAVMTTQRGGTVGLVIDISPSNLDAMKDRIATCATQAADHAINDGATLLIAPVSSSPVYMASTPIHSKLSLDQRLTPKLSERLKKRDRRTARKQIDGILGGTVRNDSSDTIAATSIMGRALHREDGPLTMVICGDAHQVGSGFNIYKETLTPERSRQLVTEVRANLGDLSGIDVIFGAAGMDTKVPFVNRRARALEQWWTQYWREAVTPQTLTYGSTLRFPR